ncbi:MAG TPA: NAD(P)/FAD-dependent oxidoreductase [Bacillus sp. (in: firmicutes)]|nr:NAD(P)/FAD-dependent oxidoreductase [Bacillus sp. (in: firmicutes)]
MEAAKFDLEVTRELNSKGGDVLKTEILIIGGGIGGLTVALKLAKCGIDVCIVEQSKGGEHLYKGELLQPKSLEIFGRMDILDKIKSISHQIDSIDLIEMREGEKGQEKLGTATMNYNIINSEFNYALMIPHEQLKKTLLDEAAKYSSFRCIQPARFQEFKEGKAIVRTEGREKEIEAHFYIGAEGRTSKTRKTMGVKLHEHTYDHHFLTVTFPRPDSLTQGMMVSTPNTFLGLFPLPDKRVRTVYLIPAGEYKEMKERGIAFFHKKYTELLPELEGYVTQIKDWKEIQLMIPVHFHADRYVQDNMVILGDAAHSVHPMAGEGMNLAIQDGDVLGELFCWMYHNNLTSAQYLKWYEKVRKPRVSEMLKISHLSAMAYSNPWKSFTKWRHRVMKQMTIDPKLHTKQMLNISGLGIWKETPWDRLVQIGLIPARQTLAAALNVDRYTFTNEDDYPWKHEGGKHT